MCDSVQHFGDALATAVERKASPVVVGLDPRWEQLPTSLTGGKTPDYAQQAKVYEQFCCAVIDVVASFVPAVKPQAAFFEECGPAGMAALAHVIAHAQDRGLLVILDAKRNDIGSTAKAYARGILGRGGQSAWGADAVTVSPYLGADSRAVYRDRQGSGSRAVCVGKNVQSRQSHAAGPTAGRRPALSARGKLCRRASGANPR